MFCGKDEIGDAIQSECTKVFRRSRFLDRIYRTKQDSSKLLFLFGRRTAEGEMCRASWKTGNGASIFPR